MVSGCVMCFLYCCEWVCPPFTAGPQSVLGQSLKASMSSWQAMSHSRFVTHHSSSALGGGVRGGAPWFNAVMLCLHGPRAKVRVGFTCRLALLLTVLYSRLLLCPSPIEPVGGDTAGCRRSHPGEAVPDLWRWVQPFNSLGPIVQAITHMIAALPWQRVVDV